MNWAGMVAILTQARDGKVSGTKKRMLSFVSSTTDWVLFTVAARDGFGSPKEDR
jgi:hypothetical protein